MNKQKQTFYTSSLLLLVVFLVLVLVGVGLAFWPTLRIFVDPTYESKPPHILPIEDKNAVYIIAYDSDPTTGIYVIYPVYNTTTSTIAGPIANRVHPAFISAAPVSLEPFINKKVNITGSIVWTYNFLRRPGFPNLTGVIKGAAVKIDFISLVQ